MIAGLTEIAIASDKIYFTAKREAGKTAEDAKADFLLLYDKFMAESENPVEPVKE